MTKYINAESGSSRMKKERERKKWWIKKYMLTCCLNFERWGGEGSVTLNKNMTTSGDATTDELTSKSATSANLLSARILAEIKLPDRYLTSPIINQSISGTELLYNYNTCIFSAILRTYITGTNYLLCEILCRIQIF